MKPTVILIILHKIIELYAKTTSNHVHVISCTIDSAECAKNADLQLIKVIKENISNTTDPCENFWSYACGSWTAEPYYDHNDNFGIILNNYADQLIKTFEDWTRTKNTTETIDSYILIERVLKYYMSCRSTTNYYSNMWRYLQELPQLFGANFNLQQFDWLTVLASLRNYGCNDIFLHESVGFAWTDSSRYVLQLRIPQAYKNFKNKYHVRKLMKEFNLIQNPRNIFKLTQEMYEFDLELVDLYRKYENSTKTHSITLADLQNLVPSINWKKYFEILLNYSIDLKTPIEFSGDFNYFEDLIFLLAQKNNRFLGNYTLIRFCKYLWGIRPLISERECLLHTNVMFPLGVDYLYNRFLYKNRLKDEMILQNIFTNLKEEFWYNLIENKFSFTNRELNFLAEKLHLMQLQIGNLPAQTSHINDYYSSIKLSTYNFYHNHLEMLRFRTHKQHEAFRNHNENININLQNYYVNDDISQIRSAPYFIHRRNMLIVPMLFLQLPFYHQSQHPVLQYSLVGWIIAHELSHAFDSHGLYLDAWGNENLIGLQISQKMSYLSSIQCLQNISPTVSLNERIADVNGLQLVWQTYSQHYSQAPELHDDFSLHELFFLNFSQFFCGTLPRPIGHDRDDIRVKVAVANIPEFSEIFKCPQGSKENSEDICKIWSI